MMTPGEPGRQEQSRRSSPVDEQLLAKEPDRIQGMFDAIASRYDFLNRLLSAGRDRVWRRKAIEALALRPSEVLLDVCTGTADVVLEALRRQPRLDRAIGIDFSHEMLVRGARKIARAGAGRAVVLRADATQLPLASGSVDAAAIAFGIRNVQQPERACAEIARVLRPAGRLAILEFGLPQSPTFRALYLWYARRILPAIGRVISRHGGAYSYLPESVGRFPPPEAFGQLLQANGFPHVSIVPLTLGIVYLYVARK
ncbi:MAG TPA: bifunctional demethylmenaquinone methyltransferase/2-methoxy-6-polyprenyl-1,4-benzoquinol methylase UbiE [Vicinamibacterales bacterium]|nr:bifunctional demethylmenaquinone methyltransferase/2-methoxy-6-polyprenyl-1,4-benzoquinol methylase UbiE [Vicinamibacterales bacterium]